MRPTISSFFSLLIVAMALSSCGEFQDILKSTDTELKFTKAKAYFEAEEYNKAYELFDDLMTAFRGTAKAQEVYAYYAKTLYEQKDYILAGYHFKRFSQTFPSHDFAEEAAYMAAYCYYLEAPSSSLDPAYIYKAMDELQLFINTHPGSTHLTSSNELMDELRLRLEEKAYNIAYGYYHRSQFSSAVTSFNAMLTDFPDSKHRENAMRVKAMAAFELAKKSIESKQAQRYKEAETAILEFMDAYTESSEIQAMKLLNEEVGAYLEKSA